jgi:D-amino peptidase
MRFYVSADIEGIAGVVSRENTRPGGFEYEAARDWMTDAVLVVCETAHEMGAKEVVVSDSHGNGQNIRFERMPDYVQLVRSWPRPLGMMQGIENGKYDGACLIGYHASAGNPGGVLSHTMSGEFFHEVRLNGEPVSEAELSAAIAAHFGVPIVMAAGDDVAIREMREALGDIAAAELKTSYGLYSAINPSLGVAASRLRDATREAFRLKDRARLYKIAGAVDLEIRLRTRFVAEWLSYLAPVERVDAFTVRYRAQDILDVSRFLMFLAFARTAVA